RRPPEPSARAAAGAAGPGAATDRSPGPADDADVAARLRAVGLSLTRPRSCGADPGRPAGRGAGAGRRGHAARAERAARSQLRWGPRHGPQAPRRSAPPGAAGARLY